MNHPFKQGDKLCNAFSVGGWDCVEIDEGKRMKVSIIQGHPKIYVLQPKVVVDETRSSLFAIGLIVATVIFLVYLILSSRNSSVTTTTDNIASKSE